MFNFFKPKSKRILSQMGFYTDQAGIMRRYSREMESWNDHLEQSKKCIVEAIEKYNPKTIAILGSGWLLDVPIEYLSKRCQKVYLYDIIQPKQIIQKISKYENVFHLESDITGGAIENTYYAMEQNVKSKTKFILQEIEFSGFRPAYKVDLIISLNILNQLDILICDYIIKCGKYNDKEIDDFRIKIQTNHIESISKTSFCLITDYEEQIFSGNEKPEITKQLVKVPLPVAKTEKKWQWKFDQSGTYYEGKTVFFSVIGIY